MFFLNKNYLSIIVLIAISIFFSCRKKGDAPVLTTAEISGIQVTTAISGGEIINEGSSAIISRGVCWSKNSGPTIADNKTIDGTGTGSFSSCMTGLEGATNYNVRAYASNDAGTGYGPEISFITVGQPPVTKDLAATNISVTTVTLNASVNANLPTMITFEFGTTTNYGESLVATQNHLTGGTEIIVNADIKGLKSSTLYHYRVKATNQFGTTYGDDLTFSTKLSDADGNVYNTVLIGTQLWMKENLKTTKYANGDLIGTTSTPSLDVSSLTEPKYQWQHSNIDYGRLYTYYAIADNRHICPVGWHIPTDAEWYTLTDYLSNNGFNYGENRSYIAKSMAAPSGWTPDPAPGNVGNDQPSNNSSGFTGFGGGGRYSNGVMNFVTYHGIWWSSTESSASAAYFRCIGYIPAAVYRGVFNKSYGLSVRCVQDN